MSRDPKTGSDAAELATEFFQSQSHFRQCRPNSDYSSQHLGVAGQRVQSGPSRSFLDPNGHTRSSAGGESHVPNGAGGEPWGVGSLRKLAVPPSYSLLWVW